MPTLYIKDNAGHIRFWSIDQNVFGNGLEIRYGVVGGAVQTQEEVIEDGKGGRTVEEQIESRIESRINKRLDMGYVKDIALASSSRPVNRLGFAKPMLAYKQEQAQMDIVQSKEYFEQNKLDGNRCIVHHNGERILAYTRNGKEFTTLDHILDGFNLEPGEYVDGELYIHGKALQKIVSLVKRKQAGTAEVEYHMYDMISDKPFSERYKRLEAIKAANPNNRIKLVPTTRISSEVYDLGAKLKEVRALGYEGLMIRSDYTYDRFGHMSEVGYEDGKRSKSLIKIKAWETEEFRVINIIPSVDGWARLECFSMAGMFTVSCPGDMAFRYEVMRNKDKYINKQVTVQFAYWTKDKMPFHPIAVAFRDYE